MLYHKFKNTIQEPNKNKPLRNWVELSQHFPERSKWKSAIVSVYVPYIVSVCVCWVRVLMPLSLLRKRVVDASNGSCLGWRRYCYKPSFKVEK